MFNHTLEWLNRIVRSTFSKKVSASHAAIAVGRDIRDSTITIGLDENDVGKQIELAQQPFADSIKALAAEVARSKGIDAAPLRVILENLGEHDVSDDAILDRFIKLADTFNELRERLSRNTLSDLTSMKANALALLDAGDFSGAYSALESGRLVAQSQRSKASILEAELLADQGHVLELQISNILASDKYGHAAALVSDDPRRAFQYLIKQANALQNEGEQFGNNDALRASISVWRSAKQLSPFDSEPNDHRKAHNNLGSAIYSLATREPTNENLLEVATMNQEVLDRDNRYSAPKEWAAAQANLGSALQKIGEREVGTEKFFESLERFGEALQTIDRGQQPADWAGIKNNMGNSLKFIGQRQNSEDYFWQSIHAYREAFDALDPKMIFQRAMTLMNMAAAFSDLGRLLNVPEPFEQSIKETQAALNLISKDRYPVQWAVAKHNIGSARSSLGLITDDISHWRDAILVNTEALAVHTREHAPLSWASAVWGIGLATSKIAAKTRDVDGAISGVNILAEANKVIAASDDESMKPGIRGALSEAEALVNELRK